MIYFEIKKLTGEVITTNILSCKNYPKFEKNKNSCDKKLRSRSGYKESGQISIWVIAEDEPSLINSNKLFNKVIDIYGNMSQSFFDYYLQKIKIHSHTLKTIDGKMKQKIDGLASKEDFHGKNYQEQKENIAKKIENDVLKAADTLCFLNKRIGEIDAHIEGFDVLYMGDEKDVMLREVNIYKVMLNISAPFISELQEKGVNIKFQIEEKFAENNKINIDYKFFNLAFSNFLDNAVKYTLPNSNIYVFFSVTENKFKLLFKMMSFRIDSDEISRIFDEGYSGRHATSAKGDGIGMSVIQKALKLTKMELTIHPDYSISEVVSGKRYVENSFIFTNI